MAKEFFLENHETSYWHVEVIYSFKSSSSKETFDIEMNQSPKDGHCSINPANGTMFTLFTIHCSDWSDEDEMKDFTFYSS